MKGYLVLEDGKILTGELLNGDDTIGEVVFNTSMTGYQEILTDPSYYGQIVVMTYPLIGNYGINQSFNQSKGIKVKGLVTKSISDIDSNCQSQDSLQHFLKINKIPLLHDIDTRYLVKIIREKGVLKGAITGSIRDIDTIQKELDSYSIKDAVANVTTQNPYKEGNGKYRIALIDYGFKYHILKNLIDRDCSVTVYPAKTSAEEIMDLNPHGILLTNGPGDPQDNAESINTIKKLKGNAPIFGICLGHQLMALACDANTVKLKYGHRGANHPVKDLKSNKCYMTSQNHGYSVDTESLNNDMEVTHVNLNDNTIEGIRYKSHPSFTVQFHPEANCGPQDTAYLFDEFIDMVRRS
ncbi:carbamoyl-phosphate synthase small chain [Oxobacter pfennigii]|uniref:Carbamoyl phosphate synthase small chain n=1 Tax=Oxobacter pfennigii TaxID=36849 RepID=A0A0P8WDG0_9CLOT|nr:carbamoyl phosphate synthase small subunit [Oxobacter pfennigii]KPU45955.1 carbamoyl-phosphate synthase small chain [Oxobacter pfennigii]